MNLREAYLYINENKLKDFIEKRCNRITSIKFMLADVVYAHVFSNSHLALNAIMCAIKGEIISRYITNEAMLKQDRYYFRIKDIENNTFDIC